MVFCNNDYDNYNNQSFFVTILILIDGFLQYICYLDYKAQKEVTILILIDGFLQWTNKPCHGFLKNVTILILIDGFLQ